MSRAGAIEAVCEAAEIDEPEGWRTYFDLSRAWASRTDLTSAATDTELAEVLFLDAAKVIEAGWVIPSSCLVDVGAGVGAPLLPILLSEENLRGTLVEPRRIRATFLRTAIGKLGLEARATVIERRVDPQRPLLEGAPFDIALSRATFAPDEWLAIGAELGHEVWVLTAGAEVVPPAGLQLTRRLDYTVPSSGAPRSIRAFHR